MKDLLKEIRRCQICIEHLPLGAHPIVFAQSSARLLLIGQAPGIRVHQSGVPWDDPSGKRLRDWLQMDSDTFYDDSQVALLPMGFCYPGKGKSGDLPPRPECAPTWHPKVMSSLSAVELTILIGRYAQNYYLKDRMKKNLSETVRAFEEYLPECLPLPHPSPRNLLWLKKNPWFETDLLPVLRKKIVQLFPE